MLFLALGVSEKSGGYGKAGEKGGVRVIYFFAPAKGLIWLLTIYAKSNKENIPSHILKALKEELVDGYE